MLVLILALRKMSITEQVTVYQYLKFLPGEEALSFFSARF